MELTKVKDEKIMPKTNGEKAETFFLSYATANDDPLYLADALNLSNLARHQPGISNVCVYLAVSKVSPFTSHDDTMVRRLTNIIDECPHLTLGGLVFKSNIGRDFSSALANLRAIEKLALPDDYVMILNRSAFGPLIDNWYANYIEQYRKFPNVSLCGTTINFNCHYVATDELDSIQTHVQTYAYLSQFGELAGLLNSFPGIEGTDRSDMIVNGELKLSQLFLERGRALTCLYWPNYAFDSTVPEVNTLPQSDVKNSAKGMPFRHKWRFHTYFLSIDTLHVLLRWLGTTAIIRPGGFISGMNKWAGRAIRRLF